jgi:hypothetical protein
MCWLWGTLAGSLRKYREGGYFRKTSGLSEKPLKLWFKEVDKVYETGA